MTTWSPRPSSENAQLKKLCAVVGAIQKNRPTSSANGKIQVINAMMYFIGGK